VAQLEENHGASVFRITAATIGAALNRELEPAQIRGLLEAGAKAPLPDTVVRLLEDQCARYGQITLSHTQTLVSVTDPAILDTLLHDRKLSGLSIRRVAPDLACIDTVDPRSAREALRVAGYLPVLGTPSNGTGGSTGASQSPRVSPQVMRFMKQRIEDGLLISVTWEQEGRTQSAVVEVNDIVAGRLETTRQPSGKDLTFDMRAILKAQVLADQTADDDSDDEYDFS
jgi:hypothetical protein